MDFRQILEEHLARYPLMTPQDLGKLAYQSEFGPEHMVSFTPNIVAYLQAEWKAAENAVPSIEPIGNGLCRFYLSYGCDIEKTAPLLAELFVKAAKEHKGTMEGLQERLAEISRLNFPGWEEWLADYAAQGYPPQRHSQIYRDAYHPHYRVILLEDAKKML